MIKRVCFITFISLGLPLTTHADGFFKKIFQTKKDDTKLNLSSGDQLKIKKYFEGDTEGADPSANSKNIILIESSLILLNKNPNNYHVTNNFIAVHNIDEDKFEESPIKQICNSASNTGKGVYAVSDLKKNLFDYLEFLRKNEVTVSGVIFDQTRIKRSDSCKEIFAVNTTSENSPCDDKKTTSKSENRLKLQAKQLEKDLKTKNFDTPIIFFLSDTYSKDKLAIMRRILAII